MRITIVPAGPKTSAATIRALLKKPSGDVEVYAVYRNLSKVPPEFKTHDNFHAVCGDVEDASSLDLSGSDAVMTSTPPFFNGPDPFTRSEMASKNVKDAVEKAGGVKRLMLLSSLGAEFEKGVGEIGTNHVAEKVLRTTDVPEILIVRCAYFMENWTLFGSSQTLQSPEPYFDSLITPLDYKLPMIAVEDIGATFATGLTSNYAPPVKPYVFALHGPEDYSPLDAQAAFSSALGGGRHVGIKAVERDQLAAFYGAVFRPELVDVWVEMATSFLPGGIAAPGAPGVEDLNIVRGKVTLEKAIKDAVESWGTM